MAKRRRTIDELLKDAPRVEVHVVGSDYPAMCSDALDKALAYFGVPPATHALRNGNFTARPFVTDERGQVTMYKADILVGLLEQSTIDLNEADEDDDSDD